MRPEFIDGSRLDYICFREHFAGLIDPDCYTLDWLDGQVFSGEFRCFASGASAILVSIKYYPTGRKELHGQAAVGCLEELTGTLIPQAEQWGREQGCSHATIESREGWLRHMKRQGYEHYQTTIRKAL